MNNLKKQKLLFIVLFLKVLFSFSQEDYKAKNKKAVLISKKFLKSKTIPGMSISILKNDTLIFSKGFGYSNIKKREKVNPKLTKFRIASISKTITALALAKLVDDKKIDFDESLYNYVPSFPKKRYDFSVREIGGHLAGFRHYKRNEFLLNKNLSIEEGLNIFKNNPLLFKPKTKFKYSTYGWNLLSIVIQNASEQNYFSYMKESIFNKLKMNSTFVDNPINNNKYITQFYIKRKGQIKIGPKVNNVFKAAGGGYLSTTEDLVLFGREFINPKIITTSSLKNLVTPQKTLNGKSTNYGIGISITKVKNNVLRYSHSGGGIGASAYLLIYPENNTVISILTNLSGVNMKEIIIGLEKIYIK